MDGALMENNPIKKTDSSELYLAYSQIPEFTAFEAETGWNFQRELEKRSAHGIYCKLYYCTPDPRTHVGFFTAYEKGAHFHLWLLGVSPVFRGKGRSTRMLEDFIAAGRDRGFTKFSTKTYSDRPRMIRALERRGFKLEPGSEHTRELQYSLDLSTEGI